MHLTLQINGYNYYKIPPSLENEALESNSVRSINGQGPLDLVVTAAPGSTCESHCHGGKKSFSETKLFWKYDQSHFWDICEYRTVQVQIQKEKHSRKLISKFMT